MTSCAKALAQPLNTFVETGHYNVGGHLCNPGRAALRYRQGDPCHLQGPSPRGTRIALSDVAEGDSLMAREYFVRSVCERTRACHWKVTVQSGDESVRPQGIASMGAEHQLGPIAYEPVAIPDRRICPGNGKAVRGLVRTHCR